MDVNTAPREELVRLVYELMDRIGVLEAENAHLREQLHQRGKGGTPSQPLITVKPSTKKKKPKERKQRDQAFTRQREVPTERVFHAATHCPSCGGRLGKPTVVYTRQVIDLPLPRYTVTDHVICKRWCYHCKTCVVPEVNATSFGQRRIGLNLASLIITIRDRLRQPIGIIQTYLKLVYQLVLSKGELVELLHAAAQKGEPAYQALWDEIRRSPVVHGDETGGRENGQNGYHWSFSTPTVHVLLYRKSRGSPVVEELVGKESERFDGVMVSDFYAAYNTYTGFHQRCWVHLHRDIHDLKEQFQGRHPPLNRWAKRVKTIYEEAKAYPGPDPSLPPGVQAQERITKQREYEQKLRTVCQPYLSRETPMSTLCGRIITFLPELFVFVRFPNVPADNNQAERILRHTVTARKISGGTRSPKGSQTKTILTSLFDTWQLQGKNPLTQCRLLLAS